MAGHKGYGLAMAVDAVCSLLSGANLSCESSSMFQAKSNANTGHFLMALDINHFLPLENFKIRAQGWFDKIKGSKQRPHMTIMIPGEPEANRRLSAKNNLNVLKETIDMINQYNCNK